MTDKEYKEACLSCLFHDLFTAFCCLNYHVKNEHNVYSKQFKDDLRLLADGVRLLRDHIDSVVNHV